MITKKTELFRKQIRQGQINKIFKRQRLLIYQLNQLHQTYEQFINFPDQIVPQCIVNHIKYLPQISYIKQRNITQKLIIMNSLNIKFVANLIQIYKITIANQAKDFKFKIIHQIQSLNKQCNLAMDIWEALLIFWSKYYNHIQKSLTQIQLQLFKNSFQYWCNSYEKIDQNVIIQFLISIFQNPNYIDKYFINIILILISRNFTSSMAKLINSVISKNCQLFYHIYINQNFQGFIINSLESVQQKNQHQILIVILYFVQLQGRLQAFKKQTVLNIIENLYTIYKYKDCNQIYAIMILCYIVQDQIEYLQSFFLQINYSRFLNNLIQANQLDAYQLLINIVISYFSPKIWNLIIQQPNLIQTIVQKCQKQYNNLLFQSLVNLIYDYYQEINFQYKNFLIIKQSPILLRYINRQQVFLKLDQINGYFFNDIYQ